MRCACQPRAFPGKVDTGFPIGNATNIESRALSGHDHCNFQVNPIGKRSSLPQLRKNMGAEGGGSKFWYVGFISRADAELVDRMV
jgi:hypothetical protein